MRKYNYHELTYSLDIYIYIWKIDRITKKIGNITFIVGDFNILVSNADR